MLYFMTLELIPGALICLGSYPFDIFASDLWDYSMMERVHGEIWRQLWQFRKDTFRRSLESGQSVKFLLSEADIEWYIQNRVSKETAAYRFQEMFSWMEKFPKFEVVLVEESGLQYELKSHPKGELKSVAMVTSLDSLNFSDSDRGRMVGICSTENFVARSVKRECENFSSVGDIKETVERLIGTSLNVDKSN